MAPIVLPDLIAKRREDAIWLVAALVYSGVTTTEIDEPVSVLASELSADVVFVGTEPKKITGIEPVRDVAVTHVLGDPLVAQPDVLVIPGGLGWERLAEDEACMRWLASARATAQGILAISTGSLLLAAAGGLQGQSATGHWLARDALRGLGADVQSSRTAQTDDERVVTASGHNAALEAASQLGARLRWGPQ